MVRDAREQGWNADQITTILLGLSDGPPVWATATRLGTAVEQNYWRRKVPWPVQGAVEDLEIAARKYLDVGRGTAALDAMHDQLSRLPIGLVFELLDSALSEINASGEPPSSMFIYEIGEAFEQLTNRADVPIPELAKREYAYLPLLRDRDRHLTLHRLMAEDAEFFVSILCDVFRAETEEARDPTEDQRARALVGYELLRSFHLVPGVHGGDLDGAALGAWIHRVRQMAREVDRVSMADEFIGHILAYAPSDPEDGAWPHRGVRSLIQELASDKIEQGICIERFNMRGVVSKAMYEGGNQERALAEQTRLWARAAAAQWPRAGDMLHDLARRWEAEAKREDERARHDQMRYG